MIVPIRPASATNAPQRLPAPDPQFAMMAAAQMHAEGRLIKPGGRSTGDTISGLEPKVSDAAGK